MTPHFGIKLRGKEDELKLTADNYVRESDKEKAGLLEETRLRLQRVMKRFDLNINYFKSLSKHEFNEVLNNFVTSNNFYEIKDLNSVEAVYGHYIMVLDEYCQVYIGTSSRKDGIKGRISQHWRDKIPLDRLDQGEGGSLHIDSFNAKDTTRIFVWADDEYTFFEDYTLNEFHEGRLVAQFPVDYCLNSVMINIPRGIYHQRLKDRALRDFKVYGKNHLGLNFDDEI